MDFFYYGGEMQINIQNQGALNFHKTERFPYFRFFDSHVEVITSSGTQLHVDI